MTWRAYLHRGGRLRVARHQSPRTVQHSQWPVTAPVTAHSSVTASGQSRPVMRQCSGGRHHVSAPTLGSSSSSSSAAPAHTTAPRATIDPLFTAAGQIWHRAARHRRRFRPLTWQPLIRRAPGADQEWPRGRSRRRLRKPRPTAPTPLPVPPMTHLIVAV